MEGWYRVDGAVGSVHEDLPAHDIADSSMRRTRVPGGGSLVHSVSSLSTRFWLEAILDVEAGRVSRDGMRSWPRRSNGAGEDGLYTSWLAMVALSEE